MGRLLFVLTKLKKPKLIVKLGSGFGYSAYWFSKALDNGKVVLTDYRKENMDYAEQMFRHAGLKRKAIFRVGEAVEIARKYKNIDILFIDIEKYQYPVKLFRHSSRTSIQRPSSLQTIHYGMEKLQKVSGTKKLLGSKNLTGTYSTTKIFCQRFYL